MHLLVTLLANAAAIFVTAYLLPGVHLSTPPGWRLFDGDPGLAPAIVTAVVLGLINTVVKPILLILTFPITLATLGLFVLVLNALLVLLASAVVPGFAVDGFWWALAFSLVLSIVNSFLHRLVP